MGTLAVEVPQIQFFDDEVVDQFQFFEKVFDGTSVVQRQLSMLDGVQYIDKLWMCPWSCRGRFRCNSTLLMQCLARQCIHVLRQLLGAFGRFAHFST